MKGQTWVWALSAGAIYVALIWALLTAMAAG